MWRSQLFLCVNLLLTFGSASFTPAFFNWETEKILLADSRGSQSIHITNNVTEFEVTSDFACPNNYRCNLQVVIESMTCVRNITSSAPDYIKFYVYENESDMTAVKIVDECGEINSTSLHENSVIGAGLNTSKILIRPVGQRWVESDFKASVFVRVDLKPVADVKEIKINQILSNFELNFVDDAQYVLTMADFKNENDELFPSASWTRSVRVSIQEMRCDGASNQKLQVDMTSAIGIPAMTTAWCQYVNSDMITLATLNPGDQLTLSALGDGWKKGLTSALVVFTTQMTSEESGPCPVDYFNCVHPSCNDSSLSGSVCIPVDMTCNKRHNCLDSCKMDESPEICFSQSPPSYTGNEYSEQLRIEVNKIGTWFVGLILVLLLLICVMALHVGLAAGQFKSLKATIITKLNAISNRSLSELPAYHQIAHEKQAQN